MLKPQKLNKQEYLIKINLTQTVIQLIPENSRSGLSSVLLVDRNEERVSETKSLAEIPNIGRQIYAFGILGMLRLYGKSFLFYVEEAQKVMTYRGKSVYKVKAVAAIKIQSDANDQLESDCLKDVCKYLRQSLLYSYQYDLTLDVATQLKDEKLRVAKSHRYWWNFHMLKPLFKANVSQEWCLRAIQGQDCVIQKKSYAGSFTVSLTSGRMLEYSLFSRREWLRGGTRYNHRGIDENGNTANFVETEQIFQLDNVICSHIQIRGSVPIFWHQVGIRATSQLTKDFEESRKGFVAHFDILTQQYRNLLCVNLMAREKGNESIITRNFEDQLKQSGYMNIKYQFVDFHTICKNYHFGSLNPIIQQNQPVIQDFSFSVSDAQQLKLIQEQKGVVRTNCLDCLDRTNVFMTKIALVVAQEIMTQLDLNMVKEFACTSLLMTADITNESKHPKFLQLFKQSWADNGDAISKVYVGTNATTTKMSKQGGGGWTGMFETSLKGIERFYRQNFEDKQKQDIYELIVGLNAQTDQQQLIDKIQTQMIQEKEQKDSTPLLVLNWNLHQTTPNTMLLNMGRLFSIQEERTPDIIIILITNTSNSNENPKSDGLKVLFTELIKDHLGKYEQVVSASMFQQITFVFMKAALMQNVHKVENQSVKFRSPEKNRGALVPIQPQSFIKVTKIIIKTQTIGIINAILPASRQEECLNQINDEAFRRAESKESVFLEQCDYVILAGDFNLPIKIDFKKAESAMDELGRAQQVQLPTQIQGIIDYLYNHDDIHSLKKVLANYQEPQHQSGPVFYLGAEEEYLSWRNRIMLGSVKGFVAMGKIYKTLLKFSQSNQQLNPQILYAYVFWREGQMVKVVEQEEEEELQEALYSRVYYNSPPSQQFE